MNKIKFLLISFFLFCTLEILAQKLATIEIDISESSFGFEVPVNINLDEITILPDSALSLFEIQDNHKMSVPFQVNNRESRILHWSVKANKYGNRNHTYELINKKVEKRFEIISAETKDGQLILKAGNRNLLAYQFRTIYPTYGVDTVYKRSGFIHPLWSPHGQVLTQIQPEDHYHHYGIWNPWTHVLFEGDTVDFWNLNQKQGTVKFVNLVSTIEGPVYSEYTTLHKHVVFKKSGEEKTALNEKQTVRIYKPNSPDYYITDITIELNCASTSPFKILEYRYAGLGWRATEQWNKNNSEILSSENKTRKGADGTRARWIIAQGEIDNDYAGIVLMSHPDNYNHPEPLRIWPEDQNGRGDVFVNFSPTKNMDWEIVPGKNYTLKYRLLVFNGHCTKEKAESAWRNYTDEVKINIIK